LNTWCFVNLTFCKPDVSDILKPDVLKPDILKPDVLWVYPFYTICFLMCACLFQPFLLLLNISFPFYTISVASHRFPAILYNSFCFLIFSAFFNHSFCLSTFPCLFIAFLLFLNVSLSYYTIPFCFSTFPCLFILFLLLFKGFPAFVYHSFLLLNVSLPFYTIPLAF
jgi:hypothetical protein